MSLKETAKTIWSALNHLSTAAWLVGLASGFITAARAASVMPGGWIANPFIPLSWFFSTLALVVIGGKGVEWGWARLHPISLAVFHYGGEDVSLVLCPSESGDFYGTGWIVGETATRRQRPFLVSWGPHENQYKRIRGGDKTPIMLAGMDGRDRTDLKLVIRGHRESAETWEIGNDVRQRPTHEDGYFEDDLPWVIVRVELRAKQFPNTWAHEYKFRLTKHGKFEIEPTMPSVAHMAAPSLSQGV